MKKTYISIIVLVLVLAGLVTYFGINSSNSDTVKLGALFPLTGGLASYGEPAQKTVQIAVDEINAAGGINGKKLEVVFKDHKCDARSAVTALEQMKTVEKANYLLAVGCSGTIISMAPQLKGQILVGSAITSPKISSLSPMVFRNYVSDDQESALFAKEIKDKGYKTVGVIYEETDYAKGLMMNLVKYLDGSGVKVVSEGFTTGSTDVRTQITKIKSAKPEVVFVSPQTVTSGDLVLGEMQKQGFRPNMIVNENILKSADLMARYSSLLNNGVSADYVVANNEKLNNILAKYKSQYGVDCPQKNICATMYDDVYLYATALKEKGNDVKGVQSYLKSATYNGATGAVTFDAKNDRAGAGYSLFHIVNGKGVEVK